MMTDATPKAIDLLFDKDYDILIDIPKEPILWLIVMVTGTGKRVQVPAIPSMSDALKLVESCSHDLRSVIIRRDYRREA